MSRKAAELGAIGAASGAAMSLAGSAALAVRRRSDPSFQPSVPVPELGRSTQGMALSLGAFSNLRYQAVSGIDRVLFERGPWLWANLAATTAFRAGAHLLAQPTRLFLQVLPQCLHPRQDSCLAGQLLPALSQLLLAILLCAIMRPCHDMAGDAASAALILLLLLL